MAGVKSWTYAGSATKTNKVTIPNTWSEVLYQITTDSSSISMVGYAIRSMLSSTSQNGIYGADACETTNGGKITARINIASTSVNIECTHSGETAKTSTSYIYVWYK